MANYYYTNPIQGSFFNSFVVAKGTNFGTKHYIPVPDDTQVTITADQAFDAVKNPSGAVFEFNGAKYEITSQKIVSTNYWGINDGCLAILANGVFVDFNRECEHLELDRGNDIKIVHQWCNNRNINPEIAIFFKKKGDSVEQCSRVLFIDPNAEIVNPTLEQGTKIDKINDVYLNETTKAVEIDAVPNEDGTVTYNVTFENIGDDCVVWIHTYVGLACQSNFIVKNNVGSFKMIPTQQKVEIELRQDRRVVAMVVDDGNTPNLVSAE